jgi:branched-chain amino acid aminotransferase
LSTIKTLNYLPGILAHIEAADRGADDAVLLNPAGRLAETSISTLFVRLSGEWLTPPMREGALPGICRAGLLASGRVREWPITIDDLKAAEALSTDNALALRSVFSIDNFVLRELATP